MKNNFGRQLYWIFKEKYHGEWQPDILKDMRRLQAGEPIDYIIGWTPFLNCKIDLAFKPLIPRSETEYWVEKAIKEIRRTIKNKKGEVVVLDIFSGSGCIGTAVLKSIERVKVDFAEIDPRFVVQIKKNLKLNRVVPSRYKVIRSDIFSNVRRKYDFVLVNPPYIPAKRKSRIVKSVLKYEPHLALFGGKNGLLYIKKMLAGTNSHLKPCGQLWLEFDSVQKSDLAKLLQLQRFNYKFYRDQYERWRYVVVSYE